MIFTLSKCRRPIPALALALAALLTLAAVAAGADGLTPYDVARLKSVRDAAVSPDGVAVAYTLSVPRIPFEDEDGPAWSELWVAGWEGAPRAYVTGEVNVGDFAWTPDGSGIAFLAKRDGDDERSLYIIPRDGGEARRVLTHATAVGAFSFSPNGSQVAFLAEEKEPEEIQDLAEKGFDQEIFEEQQRATEVWIATLEEGGGPTSGEPRKLDLEGSASELHWSPDGSRLAVALAPSPATDDALMFRRVRIVSVETGEITARVDNPGKLGAVAWSPDSRHLALLSAASLHDPTAARLTVVPAAGGVPQDLLPGFAGDVESFAWKGPETLVFVSHQGVGSSLETIAADGSGRRVLLAPEGRVASSVSVARNTGATAFLADSPSHPEELFRLEEGTARRLTDSNPWLAGKELGRQEVVRYTARDGLELEGLLIHPLTREPGQRVPLILVVHGGPEAHHSNGWLTTYSNPGQMAAARGFAVFYPNYRGSTGRGVDFAMSSQGDPAGAEFDDLVDGVDHLIETGLVDGAKVGITGGSYGGYATAWGSTYYSERFAAGVMFVGISEKLAKWGASDIPQELNLVHDRHWPWEDWDLMLDRSPVYYVEKAKTPLLILHGKNDPRVHPSQSLVLYRYLKVYGQTPVRLVWYPDEGHGNRKAAHRLDYSLRMLRWFEHYLQGPGGDKPPVAVEYERPESGETAEEG